MGVHIIGGVLLPHSEQRVTKGNDVFPFLAGREEDLVSLK